ncbi:MAG: hypothetical protein LQ338_004422 [Usnochroma carphineum]|nr:MAG: hypothetical protein LQ338_004422 [Usnochroma carphineum]
MKPERFDIAVVGAGISGIAAAKFYLDVHPDCNLVILEKDKSVGGVWNSERVYDTFYTQTPLGIWEYSDMTMPKPPEEDMYEASFKAKYTTRYLDSYVDHCVYAGKTLRARIECGFDVQKMSKEDGEWAISGEDSSGNARTLRAPKVIVASGLTSVPNIPSLPGRVKFVNPIIHQKDFGRSDLLSSSAIKRITILGAAKSAADLVYDCVKAGKSVTWIIRRTGTGPGIFVPAPSRRSASASYSIGTLRIVATLTPSLFNADSWWNRILQRSQLGMRQLTKTWNSLHEKLLTNGDFEGRGERAKGNNFAKLKPHTPVIWQNQGAGLINRPDFWDTVAENVQVFHENIETLGNGIIRLQDGQEIPADAILCGTGWVPSLGFFDPGQCAELGLPQPIESYPFKEAKMWESLEREADRAVLDRFPILANPPKHYGEQVTHTPYRLYNSIAPVVDNSIAFVGHVLIANYFHLAECQAIWATAYLDGKVKLPPLEERQKDVALLVAWCRRRYLSNGDRGHWLASEQRTYTDHLFDQLGLSSHRRFWLWDSFAPVSKKDLPRLRAEYIKKYGQETAAVGHKSTIISGNRGSEARRQRWNWKLMANPNLLPRRYRVEGSTRNIHTSMDALQRSTPLLSTHTLITRPPRYAATFLRPARLFAKLAR